MKANSTMKLEFDAVSLNEAFARSVAASFLMRLDPTVEQLCDVKTAVSEAVTNAIVHGYRGRIGTVILQMRVYQDRRIVIKVRDKGCGIPDIQKAMEPLYTTAPQEERAGLGFAVMQTLMDKVKVTSAPEKGTCVTMIRTLPVLDIST